MNIGDDHADADDDDGFAHGFSHEKHTKTQCLGPCAGIDISLLAPRSLSWQRGTRDGWVL